MLRTPVGKATTRCGALLAAMCFTFGCTAPSGPAPAEAPGSGPVTPKVQRLVMGIPFTAAVESNDTGAMTASDLWILRPMYESLIGIDPVTGQQFPMLALQWALGTDGRSFRIQLRKGVPFHNGNGEFTAKDLAPLAKSRMRDEFAQVPTAIYWRAVLDSVEPVSDYEAVYHLKAPESNFLDYHLTDQSGSMQIWSGADLAKTGYPTLATGPMAGTGPYQYVERDSQHLRFQRVPYQHWRITPDFPEFEFRWIKEPSTLLAGLLAGELHLTSLPEDLLAQAQKQGLKVIRGKIPGARVSITQMCCFLNNQAQPAQGYMYPDSPLMDPRVRRALSKAIDRDPLNKAFFGGKAALMFNGSWHTTRLGWNPEWERRFAEEYGFDQTKARALLAEKGYGATTPLRTSMFMTDASGVASSKDLIEALAGQWRAVGVDVTLLSTDNVQVSAGTRTFKWNNHMQLRGTSAELWTGATNFGSKFSSRGSGIELGDYDDVLSDIALTVDAKKRDELWRRAGDIRYNAYHTIPLFWIPVEALANPSIIADWSFPGSISGNWTHVDYIKAAR